MSDHEKDPTSDFETIQALLHRYCWAYDSGDIAELAQCFTEDGVFATPLGEAQGRPAIREFAGAAPGKLRRLR